MRWVFELGDHVILIIRAWGAWACFMFDMLHRSVFKPYDVLSIIRQVYTLGVCAVPVILFSAAFIGMVLVLQGFYTLEKFGAQAQLSQLLALSVFRELGPVMTALLYTGRSCSALAAEIGLMQVTEQIPAMEVMAIDPMHRIIYPRYLAGVIVVPCLTMIFNTVALWGGYLIAVLWLNLDAGVFWSNMQSAVHFHSDVVNGMIKSVIFALLIHGIALWKGYEATPTTGGVSRATTHTVVIASLGVLLLDVLLTALMLGRS